MAHQPSRVDLCASGNDFRLSNTLLLCSRGEGGGDFRAEDDILDEDTFDGDTPFIGDVSYYFSDLECNGFPLGYNALDGAGTDDVSEGCLGSFDECLTEIRNAESSTIWIANLEVDDGVTVTRCLMMLLGIIEQTYISTLTLSRVLRQKTSVYYCASPRMYAHDCLSSNWANLDFDVDDAKGLCTDVDLDQPRVYGLVELSETRYKTDRT